MNLSGRGAEKLLANRHGSQGSTLEHVKSTLDVGSGSMHMPARDETTVSGSDRNGKGCAACTVVPCQLLVW